MSEQPTKLLITEVKNISTDLACFKMVPIDSVANSLDFIPGQVAVLSLDGVGKGYFALASAPGDQAFEFLIKKGSGLSAGLFENGVGSSVSMTGPVGKGFPIGDYKNRDLLLMAAGTAIAPFRSVIRYILKNRGDFSKVILIYGVREPAHFAYQDEIEDWREQGINVVLTVSQPGNADWNGAIGYVQHRLEDVSVHLKDPVALICGMKDMMQQTTDELTRRFTGIQVLTNY